MKRVSIFFVFFLFCVSLFFYGTPWGNLQAKKEFKTYLEEKYDEPFKVKTPLFWVMDQHYHAAAFPIARPEAVFNVGTEQGEVGIQDNYVWHSWRYEAEQDVKEIASKYYPDKKVFVDIDLKGAPKKDANVYDYKQYTPVIVNIDLRNESVIPKENGETAIFELLMEMKQQQIPIKSFSIWVDNKSLKINQTEISKVQNESDLFQYWMDH